MKKAGTMKLLSLFFVLTIFLCAFAAPALSSDIPDPREDRLKQRVNSYYETRKTGSTEVSYTYYDPFFRAKVTRRMYEANLIEVKFHKINPSVQEITENIAKVRVDTEYEIPETTIMGKLISVPKRADYWVDDWIWIDGDWYKVFKVNLNNSYIPFFPSFPP